MGLNRKVAIDLDETIAFSEEMKSVAWTSILKDYGYCWSKENEGQGLINVPENLRPKTGLSPYEFINQLFNNLGLINEGNNDELISDLKTRWSQSLINEARLRAKEKRIKEVPGASETIVKMHQSGWKFAVTTQAPYEYTLIVLQALELVDDRYSRENDRLLMNGINYVDAIVSGEMVKNPKPDPEPLLRAASLLDIKSRLNHGTQIDNLAFEALSNIPLNIDLKPVAIIGDSESDIKAGKALGIFTLLVNTRHLPNKEVSRLNPNLAVAGFYELSPHDLERRISIKERRSFSKEIK